MSPAPEMAAICDRALAQIDVLTAQIAEDVRREVPSYRADGAMQDLDVRAVLRRYLASVLAELAGRPAPEEDVDEVIRRRAEEGVSLEDMLHSYRVGISALWRSLARDADGDGPATLALLAATPKVFEVLDRLSLRASEIQHEIAVRDARRREQVRASLLDRVLTTDTSLGPDFWDAVALLSLPRTGRFRVMEVSLPEGVSSTDPLDVESVLARRSAVEGSWFRLGPHTQTGLLRLRQGEGDLDVDELGRAFPDQRFGIGVSAPFTEIAALPRARAQANVAAAGAGGARRVVVYERDPVPVLLASAPVAARALAEATLAPVLALAPERRDSLLTTVRAWLDHDLSVAATAASMFVHRNTVNYRLRRFEELTGRSLSEVAWRSQVLLALETGDLPDPARTGPLPEAPRPG